MSRERSFSTPLNRPLPQTLLLTRRFAQSSVRSDAIMSPVSIRSYQPWSKPDHSKVSPKSTEALAFSLSPLLCVTDDIMISFRHPLTPTSSLLPPLLSLSPHSGPSHRSRSSSSLTGSSCPLTKTPSTGSSTFSAGTLEHSPHRCRCRCRWM